MRHIMRVLALLSMLVLTMAPVLAPAADYSEGFEYIRIPQQPVVAAGPKVEVREIFWYGCPHCFHLEPVIRSWLDGKPRAVQFVRMPATFSGGNPAWTLHARTYYAFEAMGAVERLHEPFFKALHVERASLMDRDSIAAWVAAKGADKAAFLKAFDSQAVKQKMQTSDSQVAAYGISSVPVLIVAGRYLTSPSMSGGNEQIIQVVNYLVARAAAENNGKH